MPLKNPREPAAALGKAGKPVAVKVYPGARHLDMLFAFSKTGRRKASVVDDTIDFMSRH